TGGSAAGQGPRSLRRRHFVSAPAPHADRSLKPRPRQDRCDRHVGCTRAARRGRGLDRRRRHGPAPDRFSPATNSPPRALPPPVLAAGKVRAVGEPVAAVFAGDPYIAEDAADLVTLEIEELPILLAADAEPGEFSAGRSTEVSIIRQGYGDVDALLRSAPIVV